MTYLSNLHLLLLSALLSLTACEEVIEVDLNQSDVQLVIEGSVTNEALPHQVRISQTVAFDQPNNFPAVSGALVVMQDDAGWIDTLQEKEPGLYETTSAMPGAPGRRYTLVVAVEGQTFTASSTMPEMVPFDDLKTSQIQFGGADGVAMTPIFTDPVGLGNNYQFIQSNNGDRLPNIFVLDDRNSDGARLSRPLIAPDLETAVGDSVTIEMRTIDRTTYKYFVALDASSSNGPNASVPANPDNNFGGACLGYFSAHTVQRRTLLIE